MDFGGTLQTAITIVAIAALAGIGLQRGLVTTLRERVEDESKNGASMKAQRDELQAANEGLQTKVDVLQSIVTGEVHLQAISDLLEQHHEQALDVWRKQTDLFNEIRNDLRDRPRPGG